MVRELIKRDLGKGIVNIPFDAEKIPANAAQDSLGWISTNSQIELTRGKSEIGSAFVGSNPQTVGHGYGITVTGTYVQYRKVGTVIQYYNGSAWSTVIGGLTPLAEYTFSRYRSAAGSFLYITGVDGIFKINMAFPASYISMYDAAKNFKGKSAIFNSRMFLWDRSLDKTGVYVSHIDAQDSTVYTEVTGEVIAAAFSGTLAFKGSTKRNCFAVVMHVGAETLVDDGTGNLISQSSGVSRGTINYVTGEWTCYYDYGGTVDYFWEDSNVKGITDFTFSATRTAGEGNVYRQDEGGDAIQNIEIYEGKYYSFKKNSVYELAISTTSPYIDLAATNLIFRKNTGISYWRSSIATNLGIIYMDSSNPLRPALTILEKNLNGDNLMPRTLANHFDFSEYIWDKCSIALCGDYIVFSGRTMSSSTNNYMFLYNISKDTVDVLPFASNTIINLGGILYIGDPLTGSTYKILNGFTDAGSAISNNWISNDELFGSETLKKVKKIKLKGLIQPNQKIEIYSSYDGAAYVLIGTILGNGTYVDATAISSITDTGIGPVMIGDPTGSHTNVYQYVAEIKLPSMGKFRKMKTKLTCTGTGYASVEMLDYYGILYYGQKLPSKYRSKQNVSTSGLLTDQ